MVWFRDLRGALWSPVIRLKFSENSSASSLRLGPYMLPRQWVWYSLVELVLFADPLLFWFDFASAIDTQLL